MNAREGMRRVGLVLGVLGGITGGVIGYSDLQNVWSSHTKFDRLQALPVMHDVATAIKAYPDYDALAKQAGATISQETGEGKPPQTLSQQDIFDLIQVREALKKAGDPRAQKVAALIRILTGETRAEVSEGVKQPDVKGKKDSSPVFNIEPPPGFVPEKPEDANGERWVYVSPARKANVSDKAVDPAAETTVDVSNHESIKTVNADKTSAISSIQLATGEWIYREPRTFKARLAFIARLLLPFFYLLIGFLIPWGTVRVFVWVGSGFLAPPS